MSADYLGFQVLAYDDAGEPRVVSEREKPQIKPRPHLHFRADPAAEIEAQGSDRGRGGGIIALTHGTFRTKTFIGTSIIQSSPFVSLGR